MSSPEETRGDTAHEETEKGLYDTPEPAERDEFTHERVACWFSAVARGV